MGILLVVLAALLLLGFLVKRIFKEPDFIKSLDGRHVVVTGGSSGIGFAIAKRCLSEGASVTLMARNEGNLRKAHEALIESVGCPSERILLKAVDVGDATAVTAAIEEVFLWKPIDILVCNAGIARSGFLEDVACEDLEAVFRINFLGSVYPVYAALPLMKQRSLKNPSSIVFVNSLCSLYFACGSNTYMASKYAQKGLAEVLRVELIPYNIGVQLVIPGFTETPMLDEAEKFDTTSPFWGKVCMYKRQNAQTSDEVARIAMEGVKKGEFLITTGMDGFFLGVLGRGPIPAESLLRGAVELLLLLPLRLCSSVLMFCISTMVKQAGLHKKSCDKQNGVCGKYN